MTDTNFQFSKFLSYVLRHKPASAGLTLDDGGWADVGPVLAAAKRRKLPHTLEALLEVVRTNDKQRFTLNADNTRIRASQGHTIDVVLGYEPAEPPETLYHGTVGSFLTSIRIKGLLKGQRQHVHLSKDEATAIIVGKRRGTPVVLKIRALDLHRTGAQFFLSANGVWLTDHVPPEYIEKHEGP